MNPCQRVSAQAAATERRYRSGTSLKGRMLNIQLKTPHGVYA